jgi:cytochrome b561
MIVKNSANHFGIIAILFHWIMALLLIGLVCVGLYMDYIPISAQKLKLYGWHKEFGILALMLVIVRFTWRLRNITPSLSNLAKLEQVGARLAHYAFYFFMFALPISGIFLTSAAGLPASFFGWFTIPALIAPSEPLRLLFTEIHQWIGYALIATFCLHVAGALKHHFIDRDDILKRMLKP